MNLLQARSLHQSNPLLAENLPTLANPFSPCLLQTVPLLQVQLLACCETGSCKTKQQKVSHL